MIDHDGSIADAVLRSADAVLRVVAHADCPPWSPRLAIPFVDIGIDHRMRPKLHGFSVGGLDAFASWYFDDERLSGRPVFAINVHQIIEDAFDIEAALATARDVAAHELAHAVARPFMDSIGDPAGFVSRVVRTVQSATFDTRSPTSHDARWWRRYSILIARMKAMAPAIVPTTVYSRAAIDYGFGVVEAAEWIAAARTTPDLIDGTLLEVASRPCPQFDNLLERVSPAAVAASSP